MQPEVREPALAGHCLHEVRVGAHWLGWPEEEVNRTIAVPFQTFLARGDVGSALRREQRASRQVVVEGEGPELLDRRVGRNPQSMALAAVANTMSEAVVPTSAGTAASAMAARHRTTRAKPRGQGIAPPMGSVAGLPNSTHARSPARKVNAKCRLNCRVRVARPLQACWPALLKAFEIPVPPMLWLLRPADGAAAPVAARSP
jgi:hypothetical protein